MALYQVQDITLLPERLERLVGFELDLPAPGEHRNVHVLHVVGWTVGREARAIRLEVLHDNQLIRAVPIRGPRADVAAIYEIPPETDCVFHALISLVGLGIAPHLVFRVVFEDGSSCIAGSMTLRREPLRTDFEPALQPLIVTTLGRSGSTWLMQLLAAHPQVVVFRRFPYESAPAKYWLHMLRVLAEPGNLDQSAHPEDFFRNRWWVGANPFHDDRVYEQVPLETWFADNYIESLADFCRRRIDDWYLTLARTQAQPAPAYFAEKHVWPDDLPILTWELYPRAKELFLVRDFRDMARSIMDFDARRGYAGFGRPPGATDEEYMRGQLRQMATDLSWAWETRGERAHLVRYEDLVLDPIESFTRILEYLGLDASPELVREVLEAGSEQVLRLPGASFEAAEVMAHRTVPDPRATIGRWREQSPDGFGALSDEVFGEALATFGYA